MELSEEEKKAIEYLTKYIHWETYGERSLETDIKTVLNLLDKKQKEIEELKLDLEEMEKSNNHKKENWVHKNVLNNYINKDKIREIIEELKKQDELNELSHNYLIIPVLQELLEDK